MEDHTVSSSEADELMVDEERHDHLQSREPQPKSCRNMHPPQSAPSFASYYGVYQAPMPSPASDTYLVPVPLHQPSPYVGPGFVLVQSPMFSSDGRQYMPMVTNAPVQAIPINETYRTGYYNVDPTRSPPSRENVRESAMRRSVHFSSNSHFEQPLATSTPRSSFSQGPNEPRRSAPTKRAWVPVHGAPVPSTFPPITTLPFQHVPSSNLTYSVPPPVNQQPFTPTFSAGAASPPSSPRILSPSAPSRLVATYPSPAPQTEYVICSSSRNAATRHPPATQTHGFSSDSGFESVDSGLDESCRSPTNSSTSAGNISDIQGRYYISAGQISFDPPLNLSSNEVRYTVPLQSSQNTTAYNETNLQMSSIQELSDGRPQLLDGSNTPDITPAEQEQIESKPAEVPRYYDASRPPQIPGEWIPPPLSSTDTYTGQWRSTPVESSYPSPDKSNLDVSSIQESSDAFFQTLDTDMSATEQNWIEAKPIKLHQREDSISPAQTVCAWVPSSSPDQTVRPARSNQALSSTDTYTGQWRSTPVESSYPSPDKSNLDISSIQESSDAFFQTLDTDMSATEQNWIEAKPIKLHQREDSIGPAQTVCAWVPSSSPDQTVKPARSNQALSSTDTYTGQWRSTPVESSYPSPDKSNLDVSSIQESSDGFFQTLDREMTATEQNWIEAKPIKLHQREDSIGPAQTVCAWVPTSSPDQTVRPARSSQAGVQTPREWAMEGVSTAVQTPCGWEGGPAVTQPATPLAYCAGSCPTNRDLSRRKRRRKKICCDQCKAEMKDKAQKEDGVQEQDSRISDVESFDAGSTYSTSHERTVVSSSQNSEENENNQEPHETTPEI